MRKPTSEATNLVLTLSKLLSADAATLNRVIARLDFAGATLDTAAGWEPAIAHALAAPGAAGRAKEACQRDLAALEQLGAVALSPLDDAYPALLAAVPHRPPVIFVRGDLTAFKNPSVGVIGTREPTRHGTIAAKRIAKYFAERDWLVVSGLAKGIDTAAHSATVAADGRTVAVLAHGLGCVEPGESRELAEQIVESGGALLTQYTPGAQPLAKQYVKRDRIQAALSLGVVLVQTDIDGGSLHASRAALQYGRLLALSAPTATDMRNREPEIAGVLKILRDAPSEVARFLRCTPDRLNEISVLRTRDDYDALRERMLAQPKARPRN